MAGERGIRHLIGKIIIPKHEEVVWRHGMRRVSKKKSFPGYLIIQMVFNDDTDHLINDCPGAVGLLPFRPDFYHKDILTKKVWKRQATEHELKRMENEEGSTLLIWKPTSLESEEAALLLLRNGMENVATRTQTPDIEVGQFVKIQHGAFKDTAAKVLELIQSNKEPQLRLEVTLLGTLVPITLPVWQVASI
jgi:transcriptional antiterminator NusG